MTDWPDGQPGWAQGYVCGRRLDDTQWLVVMTLTGGRGRLVICTAATPTIEAY